MSDWFDRLTQMERAELEESFAQGGAPEIARLAGREYRGFNTGRLPARLGIQKFIKGFLESESGYEGYNRRVEQNGRDGPWLARETGRPAQRFGYFIVEPVAASSSHPAAVLLDYGASERNPRWRPERLLRDYLVVADPSEPDVLLGKAYLSIVGRRLPVAFFVLERLTPTGEE